MEIYINGVERNVQRGNDRAFESGFEHRPMRAAARSAILSNRDNVIAVHCGGGGAKKLFDLGMAVRRA